MKIAVGAFTHESNTFTPLITTEGDFQVFRGQEIYENLDFYGPVKGIISTFLKYKNYYVEPTIFAHAVPFGEVEKEFYLKIKNELLERIKNVADLTAVVLALHGSMRVKGIGDAEGDLLLNLRKIVPKNIPIICSLDMHATITDLMMKNANAFVGFKTAPHIDTVETGERVAHLAKCAIENNLKLEMDYQRVPILIAGEQSMTEVEPMKTMIENLRQVEKLPNILSASYFLGFPWADTPENSVSSVVVTLGNRTKASEIAKWLADRFWKSRYEFTFGTEAYPPNEAITKAIQSKDNPVFLSDSGDNPTAGAPGDNTNIIRLLNEHDQITSLNQKPLVVAIVDPEACEKCKIRKSEKTKLFLGGKMDSIYSSPVEIECVTKKVIESWGEQETDLVLVTSRKLDIIITSKRISIIDPKMLLDLGIRPEKRGLVVVKSGYLSDAYKRISARSILALTKGCTDAILSRLPFKNIERPMFPFDKDFN